MNTESGPPPKSTTVEGMEKVINELKEGRVG